MKTEPVIVFDCKEGDPKNVDPDLRVRDWSECEWASEPPTNKEVIRRWNLCLKSHPEDWRSRGLILLFLAL